MKFRDLWIIFFIIIAACFLTFLSQTCKTEQAKEKKQPSYVNECYNEEIFTKDLYGTIGGKKEKIAEIRVDTCWILFSSPFHLNETRKEKIQSTALYIDGLGPHQALYNLSAELYISENEGIEGKLIENPFDKKSPYHISLVYVIKGDPKFYKGEEITFPGN